MVSCSGRRELAMVVVNGHYFAAVYDPATPKRSVLRLCSLGSRKVWPWAVVAGLKSQILEPKPDVVPGDGSAFASGRVG